MSKRAVGGMAEVEKKIKKGIPPPPQKLWKYCLSHCMVSKKGKGKMVLRWRLTRMETHNLIEHRCEWTACVW